MDNLKNQTILIVDDTPENIDLLVEILSPYYEIKVTNSVSFECDKSKC